MMYVDRLEEAQERQLFNAINTINGSQKYFLIIKKLNNINFEDIYINSKKANEILSRVDPNNGYKICVSASPFNDNWFSHEDRNNSIISVYGWERDFAPPSLKCYLMNQIAQAFLAFVSDLSEEMSLNMVHEPPIGCAMDFCGNKLDIKLSMVSGYLCDE
jgi:hypothetical protein